MLAGAVGPRDADDPADFLLDGLPVAPTADALGARAAADTGSDDGASDASSVSNWRQKQTATWRADFDEPMAGDQERPGPDVVNTPRYLQVFGSMSIDVAVLLTFCRVAQLGGALFGDNVGTTTAVTEAQIKSMEDAASALGVNCVQTLYGYTDTRKLHRLVQHLAAELRGRGNLWEGNTLENESLHASCKQMIRRSNKRGPDVTLQMLRCDETQSALLQDAEEDAAATVEEDLNASGGGDGAADRTAAGDAAGGVAARTEDLHFTGRGRRVPVAAFRRNPALFRIADALGVMDSTWVTTHSTIRIVPRFEWGAPSAMQHVRATRDYFRKPWYSFVRYEMTDGGIGWGRLRVVLRSLGVGRRNCVVLQRLQPVVPRAGSRWWTRPESYEQRTYR